MRDQTETFNALQAQILGVSFDTPEDNKAFKEDRALPFPLLSVPDRTTANDYGALRQPDDPFADFPKRISYLIDPSGIIVRSYEVDDPGGHAAAVAVDLEAAIR